MALSARIVTAGAVVVLSGCLGLSWLGVYGGIEDREFGWILSVWALGALALLGPALAIAGMVLGFKSDQRWLISINFLCLLAALATLFPLFL